MAHNRGIRSTQDSRNRKFGQCTTTHKKYNDDSVNNLSSLKKVLHVLNFGLFGIGLRIIFIVKMSFDSFEFPQNNLPYLISELK